MTRRPDDERRDMEVEGADRPSRSRRVVIPLTLDRRTFVRQGGAAVTSTALGAAAVGAGRDVAEAQDDGTSPPDEQPPIEVMNRPEEAPEPGQLQSLSQHEADTVDALTARIMPGDADDPGAHEAGVVTYIDVLLAFQEGYAEYTYLQGPWAHTQTSLEMLVLGEGTPVASPKATPAGRSSDGDRTVEVKAGEFYFDPSDIQISPGDTLSMTNEGSVQHDMAVEDWDDEVIIPRIDAGETAEYTIPEDAETGTTVTVYCTVAGHREAGMEGTLSIVMAGQRTASPAASPGAAPVTDASPQATPASAEASPNATPAASPTALAEAAALDYEFVMIDEKDIERYGYQSVLSPRDVYRIGVAALDRYTQQQYGKAFKELGTGQQDEVIGDMADGNIQDFAPALTARSFFHNLRRHTSEGMFSDPAYGGNRDMVGWQLIGFPGAQRAYLPEDIQTEGTWREPQSMDQLHPFNPGESHGDHENVILPVSGSDEGEDEEEHHGSNP